MSTPLINALVERHGFARVDELNIDDFLARHAASVLFFPGDADRLVESSDVAVILPELMKVFGGHLSPALVDKSSERALQRRYRFNAFPALVFATPEGYLGVITRILDWQDYLTEVPAILARTPGEPPPFKFPDACHSHGMPNGSDHHDSTGEQL